MVMPRPPMWRGSGYPGTRQPSNATQWVDHDFLEVGHREAIHSAANPSLGRRYNRRHQRSTCEELVQGPQGLQRIFFPRRMILATWMAFKVALKGASMRSDVITLPLARPP